MIVLQVKMGEAIAAAKSEEARLAEEKRVAGAALLQEVRFSNCYLLPITSPVQF